MSQKVCVVCGEPAVNATHCEKHRQWACHYKRAWQARKKVVLNDAKKCVRCRGRLAPGSKNFCRKHLADENLAQRRRYQRRGKLQTVCGNCGVMGHNRRTCGMGR